MVYNYQFWPGGVLGISNDRLLVVVEPTSKKKKVDVVYYFGIFHRGQEVPPHRPRAIRMCISVNNKWRTVTTPVRRSRPSILGIRPPYPSSGRQRRTDSVPVCTLKRTSIARVFMLDFPAFSFAAAAIILNGLDYSGGEEAVMDLWHFHMAGTEVTNQ